jgi:hypothetical protein
VAGVAKQRRGVYSFPRTTMAESFAHFHRLHRSAMDNSRVRVTHRFAHGLHYPPNPGVATLLYRQPEIYKSSPFSAFQTYLLSFSVGLLVCWFIWSIWFIWFTWFTWSIWIIWFIWFIWFTWFIWSLIHLVYLVHLAYFVHLFHFGSRGNWGYAYCPHTLLILLLGGSSLEAQVSGIPTALHLFLGRFPRTVAFQGLRTLDPAEEVFILVSWHLHRRITKESNLTCVSLRGMCFQINRQGQEATRCAENVQRGRLPGHALVPVGLSCFRDHWTMSAPRFELSSVS